MSQSTQWSGLLEGNKNFVSGHLNVPSASDEIAIREDLATNGQSPEIAILACADSRVAPELIFNKNLGELFVIRVAGNIATSEAIASLEYTVSALKTKTIVVLGHSNCGAVGGAFSLDSDTKPSNCLEELLHGISKNVSSCRDLEDAISTNVHKNISLMKEKSKILSSKVSSGELEIIPAVYDLHSGKVQKV